MSYVLIIAAACMATVVTLCVYCVGRFRDGEFPRKWVKSIVKKKGSPLPSRTFFRRYLPEGMKKEKEEGVDDYQWK